MVLVQEALTQVILIILWCFLGFIYIRKTTSLYNNFKNLDTDMDGYSMSWVLYSFASMATIMAYLVSICQIIYIHAIEIYPFTNMLITLSLLSISVLHQYIYKLTDKGAKHLTAICTTTLFTILSVGFLFQVLGDYI